MYITWMFLGGAAGGGVRGRTFDREGGRVDAVPNEILIQRFVRPGRSAIALLVGGAEAIAVAVGTSFAIGRGCPESGRPRRRYARRPPRSRRPLGRARLHRPDRLDFPVHCTTWPPLGWSLRKARKTSAKRIAWFRIARSSRVVHLADARDDRPAPVGRQRIPALD